jgi:hypothetical protein
MPSLHLTSNPTQYQHSPAPGRLNSCQCSVVYFLLRIGSRQNLYAYLFWSVRKPYQVPQGKSLLLRPFFCRTDERPLIVLQLLYSIQSLCRSASPLSTLATHRCYVRFKRVIHARIVQLLLDDGKHCSNSHTAFDAAVPYPPPEARVMDGFH